MLPLRNVGILVAMLSILASASCQAGTGFWSSTGPYGGTVLSVRSDPGDPDIVYAASMGGVYRSTDGGDSWQRADSGMAGLRASSIPLVIDADQPQHLYLFDMSGRLYRSNNRAVDWTPTGFEFEPAPNGIHQPIALVDVPGVSEQVFLLTRDGREAPSSPLLRSNDGGVSFQPYGSGLPLDGVLLALAFDPDTPGLGIAVWGPAEGRPLAAAEPYLPSIYRSSDGGASWTAVFTEAGTTNYHQPGWIGAVAFAAGDVVYATNEQGHVRRSDDNGINWTLVGANTGDLATHASDPDTFYALDVNGVLMSDNGGVSFTLLGAGDLTSNPTYLSALDGSQIGIHSSDFHLAAGFPIADGRIWLSTIGSGLFRSQNAGISWTTGHEGLAATFIRSLAVHPNPDLASGSQGLRLFTGAADSFVSSPALWRTNGLSSLQWQVQNTGLQAVMLRSIVVDPTTARSGSTLGSSHVYAGGSSSFNDGFINGGLYKSTSGGANWSTIDAGLPTRDYGGQIAARIGIVRAIELDRRSCEAEPRPPLPDCVHLPAPGPGDPARGPLQRVYATATGISAGYRIVRSDDAGATWINLDDTGSGLTPSRFFEIEVEGVLYDFIEQIVPLSLAVSPSDPDRLVAATFAELQCHRSTDYGPCPAGLAASVSDPVTGVFRSNDRGVSWTATNDGLPRRTGGYVNAVADGLALAMHPSDHNILWVSMNDFEATPAQRPPSIYKSIDGGQTWSASANGIPLGTDMRSIVVDPGDGNRLYAAGAGSTADPGSVYRSDDGGASWRSISIGLPADSAFVLAIDPHNFNVLHAGTNSGVWSMEQLPDSDGDGIPDAVENFAPGGGDGNNDEQLDATQRQVGSTIVLFGLNRPEDIALKAANQVEGGGGYVTNDVLGGTGTCDQAVDVQNRLASRYGRDYLPGLIDFYRYPRDLVQFEIIDCNAASIDVTFHNADFASSYGWSMRFHGPATPGDDASMGWYDISPRAELVAPNRWRLQLDANQFGSYRPVDDRIFFLGGPACYDDRILSAGFEAVSTALPGCNAPGLR